jgi:hypothetical protein
VYGTYTHLTLQQKRLIGKLDEVADICRLNYKESLSDGEPPYERTLFLERVVQRMVIGFVVETYTLVDDLLTDMICNVYLSELDNGTDTEHVYETKRLNSFVHNAMDIMYPLQKLRLINDIEEIPKEFRNTIERMNSLRNALAHSFFPELRRDHQKRGYVEYRGRDIFSLEGLRSFDDDRDALIYYLWEVAHGEPLEPSSWSHSPDL